MIRASSKFISVAACFFFCICLQMGVFTPSASAGAKPDIKTLSPHAISLKARVIHFSSDRNKTRFGQLEWRGGLNIISPSPYWGGFSSLVISEDGKQIMMISDAGFWARTNLNYQNNRLTGVSSARVGPLLSRKGNNLHKKKDRDAEAITLLNYRNFDGPAYISFEINHRIGLFKITPNEITKPKRYLKLPSVLRRLKGNAGLEALAMLRGGRLKDTLVLIPQSHQDNHGNYYGWMLKKGRLRTLKFTAPPRKDFRITDAASLPNGDLVLLERRFKLFEGIHIRLRRVRQKELVKGRPIKGEILLAIHSSEARLDNMEGLAVHQNKKGELIFTLLSDDNFNGFQNTYLMQFAYKDYSPKQRSAKKQAGK